MGNTVHLRCEVSAVDTAAAAPLTLWLATSS